jgi:hypothetical protein
MKTPDWSKADWKRWNDKTNKGNRKIKKQFVDNALEFLKRPENKDMLEQIAKL